MLIMEGYRKKNVQYIQTPIRKKIDKNRITIERLFAVLKRCNNLKNPPLCGHNRYKSINVYPITIFN